MPEINKIQTTVTAKLESVPQNASISVNEHPYTKKTVSAIYSLPTDKRF